MNAAEVSPDLAAVHLAAVAQTITDHVLGIGAAIDAAHGAGHHVPPAAAEALATVSALAVAWAHNAQGIPAPAGAKQQLGLPAIPSLPVQNRQAVQNHATHKDAPAPVPDVD